MRFNNKNLGIGGIRYTKYLLNSYVQNNKSTFIHQTKILKGCCLFSNPYATPKHSKSHSIINNSKSFTINEPIYGFITLYLCMTGNGEIIERWSNHYARYNIDTWGFLDCSMRFIVLTAPNINSKIFIRVREFGLIFSCFKLFYEADTEKSSFIFPTPINIT